MKHLILALSLLAAAGCSTLKATDYDRAPNSQEDALERDSAACEMESKKHAQGYGWAVYSHEYNDMFDSCMRSKGHHRK